jgi:multiple sugar transport system permease protein
MRRPLAFVLVAATVANFVLFAPIQILTKGGPQKTTNLIMFEAYQRAYAFADVQVAAAEVMLLMVIMVIVVIIQFRILQSEV